MFALPNFMNCWVMTDNSTDRRNNSAFWCMVELFSDGHYALVALSNSINVEVF